MLQKTQEQYIQEDLKVLQRRLKDLNSKYDEKLRELNSLPDAFEATKNKNAGIIASQEVAIKKNEKTIQSLEHRQSELRESVKRLENSISSLHAVYLKSKNFLQKQIEVLQSTVNELSSQEQELMLRKEVAQKALNDIISYRVDTDIENSLSQEELKAVKTEIDRISADLVKIASDKHVAEQSLLESRDSILKNQDDKKQLAIRLHDVEVLQLRLQPEFQSLLQSYLSKNV